MMPIRNRRRRGFLSTPSARRATTERPAIGRHGKNFYPRPPRGGRRVPTGAGSARRNFYPRPPRGGRLQRVINCIQLCQFLSTPSARRATHCPTQQSRRSGYFYPRPPRGGRRKPKRLPARHAKFLSTPSARRATHFVLRSGLPTQISIHALREEGDALGRHCPQAHPISIHALREEGDGFPRPQQQCRSISIHALREEGDFCTFWMLCR